MSLPHTGLAADSRHCYRLVARRGTQTKTSESACAYTQDGLFLRNQWRVQLRITTGDVANGETADDVRVGVFGPINGHSGGSMVLDHDIDDFERGQTTTTTWSTSPASSRSATSRGWRSPSPAATTGASPT